MSPPEQFSSLQHYYQQLKHLNELLIILEKPNNILDQATEIKLRQLEKKMVIDNYPIIKSFAADFKSSITTSPYIIDINCQSSAILARYIIVPILYKLGFLTEAATLNQQTF